MKMVIAISLLIIMTGILVPAAGGCSSSGGQGTGTEDSAKMPDSVLAFIKKNHPETSLLIPGNISWTSAGLVRKPGYSSQIYSGGGWTVTIGHAVIPQPVYDVKAENTGAGIIWTGKIQNEQVEETGYRAR